MSKTSKLFMLLAALVHIAIFCMQSLFFMNENIYSRFLVASLEHAQVVELFAFNQGWYNLLLALGAALGVFTYSARFKHAAQAIGAYACFSMVVAACVLIYSEPTMLRAAVVQGIFPAIALVSMCIGLAKR